MMSLHISKMEIVKKSYSDPSTDNNLENEKPVNSIEQFYVDVISEGNKYSAMIFIFLKAKKPKTVVFVGTPNTKLIRKIKEKVKKKGITASSVYEGIRKAEFVKAMNDFNTGVSDILVSTYYHLTNIDFHGVKLIFIWNIPKQCEEYISRINDLRLSKFSGIVISMCDSSESNRVFDFVTLNKIQINDLCNDFNKYIEDKQSEN